MVDGTWFLIDSHLDKAKNNALLQKYLDKGRINYPKVTKQIGLTKGNENSINPSTRLQSALNSKYETTALPEWLDKKYRKGREHLSHRARKFEKTVNSTVSTSTLSGMLIGFRIIGRFASLLPEELESLGWCAELNAEDLGKKYGYSHKKRTPTIPVQTAMEYLDNSLAWIVEIGPDLVTAKHDCDGQLKQLMEGKKSRKDHFAKQVDVRLSQALRKKLETQGLNIKRYNAHASTKNHAYIRNNLSIEEAVECLVAACFIVISTFSCKRISEVLNLTTNCARPALDGGWEIVFGLRKASPVEALSLVGRPVPDVVRQAIDLLFELRPKDIVCRGEDIDMDPLFLSTYKVTKSTHEAIQLENSALYGSIELFADIVEIKMNPKGQRWYLRSHECRRFFAITYFWHERYAGLPALSWFMGHNDIVATMGYVSEEIIASEMPEEEARYAAIVMQEKGEDAIPGLEQLANEAKIRFNTNNLNIINQHQLEDYLKLRFEQGYRIVKHGHDEKIIYLEEHYDN